MSAHYEISPVLRDEKHFCKDTVTSAGSYDKGIKLNGKLIHLNHRPLRNSGHRGPHTGLSFGHSAYQSLRYGTQRAETPKRSYLRLRK